MKLSYSLHLGNDKNKSIKARQEAKLQRIIMLSKMLSNLEKLIIKI